MPRFRLACIIAFVGLAFFPAALGGLIDPDALERAKALASFFNKVPNAGDPTVTFFKDLLAEPTDGPSTLFIPISPNLLSKDRLVYGRDKFKRILKFHMIKGRKYRAQDLKALPEDTKLVTAEGSTMKVFSKKNATVVLLQGRVFMPSALIVPNVYVGKKMAVHVISMRLLPTSF